jgi:hypothetical protein
MVHCTCEDLWCVEGLFILEPSVAFQDPWCIGRLLVVDLC